MVPHVADRVQIWLDPWSDPTGNGYQLVQSIYAISERRRLRRGPRPNGVLLTPEGNTYIPFLETDFIYSAIAQELGLAGAAGAHPPLPPLRLPRFRIAMLADDGFSKLLAAGLTAAIAIQAFIIVGGVSGLIPLTGITLPFVSYGGSSIVANFIVLALLLMVSDRVNRGGRAVNPQIRRLFFVFAFLFVALIAMSTYWLWRAPELEARQGNPTLVVRQLDDQARADLGADGRTSWRANRQRKLEAGRTWYLRALPAASGSPRTPVGYSTIERSRTGLEQSMNDYLTGSNANLSTLVDRALDTLQGHHPRGQQRRHDARTSTAQRAAMHGWPGTAARSSRSSPRPAASSSLASTPTYDPNLVEDELRRDRARSRRRASPPRRSSTARRPGRFVPGSTFKVVTAAAALDTGAFTPESRVRRSRASARSSAGASPTSPTRAGSNAFGRVTSPRRSRTRSTPSSATSARSWARGPSSSTPSASASTTGRRSSSRRTRCSSAASTATAACTSRRTPPRSIPGGSPSARSA